MKKQRFISVLVKEPGEHPEVRRIPNDYLALQKIVGGCFDFARPARGLVVIVNDVSAINGSEFNCIVNGYPFFGTMIFAGDSSEDLCDVPPWLLNSFIMKGSD